MRPRLFLPLAMSVAACNQSAFLAEPPEASRDLSGESLVASAGPEGIQLENRTGQSLRFAVVDSLFFEDGLASWCISQDECGTELAAGERRLIPPDDIIGPPPRQKAVQVLWWDLRPGTPEEKTMRFQRIYLRLP